MYIFVCTWNIHDIYKQYKQLGRPRVGWLGAINSFTCLYMVPLCLYHEHRISLCDISTFLQVFNCILVCTALVKWM
jgi:hypothetical protein